jgi:hypothetical protein
MKQLLTITLLFIFLSCGQNNKSNRSDLLTSSVWTIEKASVETLIVRDGDFPKMMFEKYKFLTDGTCLLTTGETEIYGEWSWAKNDEIYIKPEGLVLNGQKIKNDANYGLNMKIVELTDKIFRTLESVEADHRNSGVILKGNYTASNLE